MYINKYIYIQNKKPLSIRKKRSINNISALLQQQEQYLIGKTTTTRTASIKIYI